MSFVKAFVSSYSPKKLSECSYGNKLGAIGCKISSIHASMHAPMQARSHARSRARTHADQPVGAEVKQHIRAILSSNYKSISVPNQREPHILKPTGNSLVELQTCFSSQPTRAIFFKTIGQFTRRATNVLQFPTYASQIFQICRAILS